MLATQTRLQPTPTDNARLPHNPGGFDTLLDAVEYAARGVTGMNFYSARGELIDSFSYAEMRDQAAVAARRMIGLGLKRGDRVLLPADTCRSFIVQFVACQYAALLPVPVAIPVIFGERQDYIAGLRSKIVDSGADAAITPDNLAPFLLEAAQGLDLKFVGSASEFDALPAPNVNERRFGADDLAYLQYSSGSTRAPAGIEITQSSLMNNVRHMAVDGINACAGGDRAVSWLPLYHDMGLVGFFLTVMCSQFSVDYIPTRDFARRPITWLKLISENGGTVSYSPSFGYELCCRQATRIAGENLDLTSWRAAGIGGDMVRPQILRDFAEQFRPYKFSPTAFLPSYGLAEVTLAASFTTLGDGAKFYTVDRAMLERREVVRLPEDAPDEQARTFVACGRIIPEHEMEIRDDDGVLTKRDRIGRIFLRGPSVMRGYYGKPEETRRVLDEDGWLDTGDLGFVADGDLVITGRAKDLILVNGRNVWPQDLEWTAEALPKLRRGDTAAFSIDDGGTSERVVMLVQARTSDPEQRNMIAENVDAALKKVGITDALIRLVAPSSLPQTSSGKLSRARAKLNFINGVYGDPKAGRDLGEDTPDGTE